MNFLNATNQQLWTIMRADAECPIPLLERVFTEALDRGMIRQFVLKVMKSVFDTPEKARNLLKMDHDDIIQVGYVGAIKAIKSFVPGKGTFTNLLFLTIKNEYGQNIQEKQALKRKGDEVSYHETFNDSDESIEFYLADKYTNVEYAVIQKIRLEEKLSGLTDIQKQTFLLFLKGYTYEEIGERMHSNKAAVSHRMKTALKRMTGKNINLSKLGIFSRPSTKKQGGIA